MSKREEDAALAELLGRLEQHGYRFVTVTPLTHQRVLARRGSAPAESLRDIFGWSLPFDGEAIDGDLLAALGYAGMLECEGTYYRSGVRVSTVCGRNYLHSRFPTEDEQSVFLGPDSYRFANLIADELERVLLSPGARIVDIGTGAGVGAVVAADNSAQADVIATDINRQALRLARINAEAAGKQIAFIEADALDGVEGTFDLALLNPPYMTDAASRAYRDGGGMHGGELSLQLAAKILPRLRPGGRLILYTGSAIVDGEDELGTQLHALSAEQGCTLRYREIDPDVFGEELVEARYAAVDRIAVVSAVFTRAA